jgi:hypothetical protein
MVKGVDMFVLASQMEYMRHRQQKDLQQSEETAYKRSNV